MGERIILHCDMNNFFASVECRDFPHLKNNPVAVCGSQEERHGIVLAKNQLAKMCGVKTGEPIWMAKKKCPGLLTVPPHYDRYLHFSKKARQIYSEYTDRIESFGIDEAWLDITGSTRLFGCGTKISDELRKRIKEELGLTISIGLSFNKIFAKLGSDMKKPDGFTIIPRSSFREKIWHLPASDMLFIGPATTKKLNNCGLFTIGDLANAPIRQIELLLGKNGVAHWRNANGLDNSIVQKSDWAIPAKSIGNSTTAHRDLENNNDVWQIFLQLSENVSYRMRCAGVVAKTIQIHIRDKALHTQEHQIQMATPIQNGFDIAKAAMEVFCRFYNWGAPVRSVGVRAIDLESEQAGVQISLLEDYSSLLKRSQVEKSMDKIRDKYGKSTIGRARLLYGALMNEEASEACSFNFMSR